jgi:hypothetical protein
MGGTVGILFAVKVFPLGTDATTDPVKVARQVVVEDAVALAKTEKENGVSDADIVAKAVEATEKAKLAAALTVPGTAGAVAAAEAVLTADAIEKSVKAVVAAAAAAGAGGTTPTPPPPLKTVKGYYPNGAISLPESAISKNKNSEEACKRWAKDKGYAAWTYNKTEKECSGFTKVYEKFPGNENDAENVTGCTFSEKSPDEEKCPPPTTTKALDTNIVEKSAEKGYWEGHTGLGLENLKKQPVTTIAECREWARKAGYAGWTWQRPSHPLKDVQRKCDGIRYVFRKFEKATDFYAHTYTGCAQTYQSPKDVICPAVGGTVQYKVGYYSYSYGYSYRILRSDTLGPSWEPSPDFHVYSYEYPGTTAYTVATTNDQKRCLVLKGKYPQYAGTGTSGWGAGADGQGYSVFYAWDDESKKPPNAVAFSVGGVSGTKARSAVVLGTNGSAAGTGWEQEFTFWAFKSRNQGY